MTGYRPMTLAGLAGRLARTTDGKTAGSPRALSLPSCTTSRHQGGDERWDTLLAALAEHLAAGHDAAPPSWVDYSSVARLVPRLCVT